MERIVCDHLTAYLESNSLLSDDQFGFRRGRSTSDQLLLVYNSISKCVDLGGICNVILFDLSKAFDTVCHDILLSKLCAIGIDGSLLNWISSVLKNRKMQVYVKGILSQDRDVLSGVTQGSALGPLLFLICINNVADKLSSDYKIFADDLKLSWIPSFYWRFTSISCRGTTGYRHLTPYGFILESSMEIIGSSSYL